MASGQIKTAFSTFNGYAPKEGTKALPVPFDFSGDVSSLEFDLLLENTGGIIQMVQSMWVDNADNPNPLLVTFGITQQRIKIPPFAHGMWPVITVDQTRVRLESVIDAAAIGQIILMNVPMPYTQGGPVTVNAEVTAAGIVGVSSTNFSGTIAAAGVSQSPIGANAARKGLLIQNPSTEAEILLVDFGANAAPGSAIELLPGECYPPNGSPWVPVQSINVRAATAGHAFIVKELA